MFLALIFHFAGGHWKQGSGRNFKGGKKHRPLPNANVPSELRDPEQVRKGRQQKANKVSQMKNKSKKGKKHGKMGNRK